MDGEHNNEREFDTFWLQFMMNRAALSALSEYITPPNCVPDLALLTSIRWLATMPTFHPSMRAVAHRPWMRPSGLTRHWLYIQAWRDINHVF